MSSLDLQHADEIQIFTTLRQMQNHF